ncbi:hypothetical protein FOL47_011080 [Perkinsus chesapeaki]|uniref:Uncharacterized protein n=1 Tax=Perkinsus chesapeaki TaxID=330153 RepID=A0A7J6KZW6_PERCH|nr:hypothetical protein FOL47_011080 [Perkinsus chesapeaki]
MAGHMPKMSMPKMSMPNVPMPPKGTRWYWFWMATYAVGFGLVVAALADYGITQEFPRCNGWSQLKHQYDSQKKYAKANMDDLVDESGVDLDDALVSLKLSQYSSACGLGQMWIAFGSTFLAFSFIMACLPICTRRFPWVRKLFGPLFWWIFATGSLTFAGEVSYFALGDGFTYKYKCLDTDNGPRCDYVNHNNEFYPSSYCQPQFIGQRLCQFFPTPIADTAFFAMYALVEYAATCTGLTCAGCTLVVCAMGYLWWKENKEAKEEAEREQEEAANERAPLVEGAVAPGANTPSDEAVEVAAAEEITATTPGGAVTGAAAAAATTTTTTVGPNGGATITTVSEGPAATAQP